MFGFAFSEEADIYRLPLPHETLTIQPGSVLVTGDAHGNVINQLHKMIRHGVIQGICEDDYLVLVTLYLKDIKTFTRQDLLRFDAILVKATYSTHTSVIWGGDDLADRGFKDPLMMRLVANMRRKGVPLIILLSNHTIEAIECFEQAVINETADGPFKEPVEFTAPRISNLDSRSLQDIETMIRNRVVTQAELVDWYIHDYRPALRLIHCFLTPDNQCVLLTHAPSGLAAVQGVCRHPLINQPYEDSSAQALVQTVGRINSAFMRLAEQTRIRELYDPKMLAEAYKNLSCLFSQHPIEGLMCNRKEADTPAEHNGFSLIYIHGHCDRSYSESHLLSLNSALGQANNHIGKHHVFYMSPISLPALDTHANKTKNLVTPPSVDAAEEVESDAGSMQGDHPPPNTVTDLLMQSAFKNLRLGVRGVIPSGSPIEAHPVGSAAMESGRSSSSSWFFPAALRDEEKQTNCDGDDSIVGDVAGAAETVEYDSLMLYPGNDRRKAAGLRQPGFSVDFFNEVTKPTSPLDRTLATDEPPTDCRPVD